MSSKSADKCAVHPLIGAGIRIRSKLPAGLLWLMLVAGGVSAAPPDGYRLAWSDEFNENSLDTNKWRYWLLGHRRDALDVTNAISLDGGNLVITTYTANGTNYSGMVATRGKFQPRFGYWEARIEWGDTNGMWSAFWLQSPTMGSDLNDPAGSGSEIDVAEHRFQAGASNNIADQVQPNIHWNGYGRAAKSSGGHNYGNGLADGFHVYGFLWTATNYAISIDGVVVREFNYANNHVPVSHSPEYLILSSEVDDTSTHWAGSIPAGGYGDLNASSTKLRVDYVRYYAPASSYSSRP